MKREPSRKILGTFSLTIKTDRDLPGSRNSRRKYTFSYVSNAIGLLFTIMTIAKHLLNLSLQAPCDYNYC